MNDQDTPGVRRAWGWVGHLRDGGTTPWGGWTGAGPAGGEVLPGAQQLELLRRLNSAGRPSTTLVGRVLTASAPGRGRPDLELEGAVDRRRFGPPPVDPGELPDDELLRVASSLLAEDVVAAGPAAHADVPQPGWVRPWRTRYRLAGDPALTEPLRAQLVARGRPPGGRRATLLVLGTDMGRLLSDVWEHRCFDVGGASWSRWLDTLARHDRLPPRADLLTIARDWTARSGGGRVEVVLDPSALPRLVGVRRLTLDAAPVSADSADLARRVAAVLGLLVVPRRREELLREVLRPRLVALGGPPAAVPERHHAWMHAHACRVRDGLLRAGYPVHGDPDGLLPRARTGVEPSDAGVLALALRLLLDEQAFGRSGHGAVENEGRTR
ncbi:hypothetical protein ACT8ZV_14905 [Nocardioides sp. MAHUQ-72]|uniref:hypothetical protein n=1 Tax=unclassified Nocardioides TaxID=2615069 RepID=UPI003623AB26